MDFAGFFRQIRNLSVGALGNSNYDTAFRFPLGVRIRSLIGRDTGRADWRMQLKPLRHVFCSRCTKLRVLCEDMSISLEILALNIMACASQDDGLWDSRSPNTKTQRKEGLPTSEQQSKGRKAEVSKNLDSTEWVWDVFPHS